MAKEFEASKPIYIQIAEQIFQKIVRSEISPGEKLPSVREMAIQLGVNPNTIQRTYSEMERMGVVETKRGQGTFVIGKEEIIAELKETMQKDIIGQFVNSMEELGLSKAQMMEGLVEFLKEGDRGDDSTK